MLYQDQQWYVLEKGGHVPVYAWAMVTLHNKGALVKYISYTRIQESYQFCVAAQQNTQNYGIQGKAG